MKHLSYSSKFSLYFDISLFLFFFFETETRISLTLKLKYNRTQPQGEKNRHKQTLYFGPIQQQNLPKHRRLHSSPLLRRTSNLSKLSKLMRYSVVVPFQMSHKPAPKGPKQLQRTLDDHPILTIAVTFINSFNHPS